MHDGSRVNVGKQGGQPFLLGVAMKKIRIVVADHEKSYIESFSAYLRNSEEANRFIPTYFTSRNVLQEFWIAMVSWHNITKLLRNLKTNL